MTTESRKNVGGFIIAATCLVGAVGAFAWSGAKSADADHAPETSTAVERAEHIAPLTTVGGDWITTPRTMAPARPTPPPALTVNDWNAVKMIDAAFKATLDRGDWHEAGQRAQQMADQYGSMLGREPFNFAFATCRDTYALTALAIRSNGAWSTVPCMDALDGQYGAPPGGRPAPKSYDRPRSSGSSSGTGSCSAPTASSGGGPTARCNDGTASYSQHRQGTCSHHGGVASWGG